MKKGVTLRVQVYIEGEDAPANDFSKTGQNFIMQVLATGMKGYTGPYLLGVKQITPLEGSDGDDDSDDSDTDDDASSGFLASWSGASGTSSTASAGGPAGSTHPGSAGPTGAPGQ